MWGEALELWKLSYLNFGQHRNSKILGMDSQILTNWQVTFGTIYMRDLVKCDFKISIVNTSVLINYSKGFDIVFTHNTYAVVRTLYYVGVGINIIHWRTNSIRFLTKLVLILFS